MIRSFVRSFISLSFYIPCVQRIVVTLCTRSLPISNNKNNKIMKNRSYNQFRTVRPSPTNRNLFFALSLFLSNYYYCRSCSSSWCSLSAYNVFFHRCYHIGVTNRIIFIDSASYYKDERSHSTFRYWIKTIQSIQN